MYCRAGTVFAENRSVFEFQIVFYGLHIEKSAQNIEEPQFEANLIISHIASGVQQLHTLFR